jgi:hypothetical protein
MNLSVRARFGTQVFPLTTTDMAADGMFLVSPMPPRLHELVHLTVMLPDVGELQVRAMVVHVVTGEMACDRRSPAGVGVQFYGLGKTVRSLWEAFYLQSGGVLARGWTPDPTGERSPAPAGPGPERPSGEPVRPRSPEGGGGAPGRPAEAGAMGPPLLLFRIRPSDIEGVRMFRDTALESGGLTLVGAPPPPKEALVVVAIVHPLTRAEFHVPGRVVRRGAGRTSPAVRFIGVTERTKADFDFFARHGAPRPSAAADHGERDSSLTESFEETQQDLSPTDEQAHVVDEVAPFDPVRAEPADGSGSRGERG